MPRLATSTALAAVTLLGLLAAGLRADEEETRPWSEQAFLGLSARDTKDGLVVGWISPGPLGGRGFESTSGIRRGDNVTEVDGKAVDGASLRAYVKTRSPGDSITLTLRRSPEARADGAVPEGGTGGEPFRVEVELGDRDTWAGTVGRGLGQRSIPAPREGALEARILQAAADVGVREGLDGIGGGLDALLSYLRRTQEDGLDPNSLPAVVNAFRRPLSVDAVEADVAGAVREAAAGDLPEIEALIRLTLDLRDPEETIREVMEKPSAELTGPEIRTMVRFAGQHLEEYQFHRGWRPLVEQLLTTLTSSIYIYDEHADQHVRTINHVAGPRAEGVLSLALTLLRFAPADWEELASAAADGEPLEDVPPEVRAAVGGDVLWHGTDPLGHLAVVGGQGENRYDMGKVASVYDLGGDDHYAYGAAPESSPIALRMVIDLAGDDVHESATPFEGPATAVYGFSFLDDRAGSDVYRSSHPFSVGAGLMGIGILRDRAGDDRYENVGKTSGWSIGAGFWGAGLILDEAGHDVYRGEKLVQGVGGPRGFGVVIDEKGKDLYVANGPSFASAYGTPAVYVGMSQGFGFGVRGYASGGVGAIYDLGGHDRYVAGEFSQAGGYYFGLGILHDVAGHDLYHGNRYGQAFSAHQAVGILVDDAGDDTYWSMTAASQAGTWDQSIGLLLDRAGNDAYRCDGLGQGGASMQAIAILADLAGDDRYTGSGKSVQGQGGGNRYHYDADRVFSFSALFDLGGGRDVYSSGRKNDTTVATGRLDEKNPAGSSLYGVFQDR